MDKKKSILNVTVSVGFKLIILVMSIWVRRNLIRACGNDVNGLNSLYLSIIGFLAVAELGVGSAISFCMYRPIVEGDNEKVSALYQLFRKWYLGVGALMLIGGLALTPFIHVFAKDYAELDVNLYITFVLMLVSVVLSYVFGAKSALINAYKNNYITTAISSGGILLQNVLQIIVLYATKSFEGYLSCRIVTVLVQWYITEQVTKKRYRNIISVSASLDKEAKQELSQKIRAMFMHKIGYFLVNTVDSVVISVFIGVVALGEYSNYITIQQSIDNLLKLAFSSLASVIGHMYVMRGKDVARKYHELFHLGNFMLGLVVYLGYYATIDDLIAILFGENLVAVQTISMVIAINGFVQSMRASTLIFREATGTFYYDRWKPLVEGTMNIVLSVLLVKKIGVVGVIVATIITNLLICHIIEPYVLYKNAFNHSVKKFYLRNYAMILLFGGLMVMYQQLEVSAYGHWGNLVTHGMISLSISLPICVVLLVLNRKMRNVFFKGRVKR